MCQSSNNSYINPTSQNVSSKGQDMSLFMQVDGNVSMAESEKCDFYDQKYEKTTKSLPVLQNYNFRSFFGKSGNFCTDMKERLADVCFITEPWEVEDKTEHLQKIEKMLENKGISYISTTRPPTERGGGA